MSRKSARRNIALFVVVLLAAGAFALYRFNANLEPVGAGPTQLVRYAGKMPLSSVLHDLQERKIIRSAAAVGFYAKINKKATVVEAGTYSLAPNMTPADILKALMDPVTIKVTVPEYYWVARTAELMEKLNVAKKEEYVALANKPQEFAKAVEFPLPHGSLEGYLFPDTYKMQPLVGAKAAITQQLENFERRIWRGLNQPKNLNRAVIIASMVEREARLDSERPIIAGVIENRLAKGMPLEIDATVLYAQQDWHEPTRSDIRNTISPYNTYLNRGLPPGPICSPSLKSIKAALNPATTNYLYYVAMPDGHSLFGSTLDEHNSNVARRRRALRRGR